MGAVGAAGGGAPNQVSPTPTAGCGAPGDVPLPPPPGAPNQSPVQTAAQDAKLEAAFKTQYNVPVLASPGAATVAQADQVLKRALANRGTTTPVYDGVPDRALENAFKTQYNVRVPSAPGTTSTSEALRVLNKIWAVRQARVADVTLALANYVNKTGQVNQVALVKLQQEKAANASFRTDLDRLMANSARVTPSEGDSLMMAANQLNATGSSAAFHIAAQRALA